jgi:hypothetical protein
VSQKESKNVCFTKYHTHLTYQNKQNNKNKAKKKKKKKKKNSLPINHSNLIHNSITNKFKHNTINLIQAMRQNKNQAHTQLTPLCSPTRDRRDFPKQNYNPTFFKMSMQTHKYKTHIIYKSKLQ